MNDILLNLTEGKYMKLLISLAFFNNQCNQCPHSIEQQHRTTEDYENAYSMDAVMDSLRSLPTSSVSGCSVSMSFSIAVRFTVVKSEPK